tara:strand:- start:3907 stop:4986 length:1080 start_codon:yes stop_codon:yes gene_type:complete
MGKRKVWEELQVEIDRGVKGLNVGLPMGFNRLNKYIAGVQQGRYDTWGGATGTGKTAIVDEAYVFNPYDHLRSQKDPFNSLEIIYYSLEIDPVVKIAKFISRKIWEDHGILTNVNEIFSRGIHKLPREVQKLIPTYQEYFNVMQDEVLFFRNSLSPDYLYSDVMKYAESRGKVERNEHNIVTQYTPNDPNLITLIIIDHISLIDKNKKDSSKKEAMDRASKMLVFFRNTFKFSPVVVSQFNRGIEGMDRKKQDSVEPQLSDFKDTGATQEDANTVIALFNPFRYGIAEHRGYPILEGNFPLRRSYRSGHILKNRDGMDSLSMGFHFQGAVGKFEELPKASDIKANPKLLEDILNKNKIV